MKTNLQGLAQEQVRIKKQIGMLQLELDSINESISSLCGNDNEGSKTLNADGFKITVTHKINRRLNLKEWNKVKDSIRLPDDYKIVQSKESLNNAAFKKLEKDYPEWLQYTSDFVTVSKAKTSVIVEELEKEK